MTKTPGDKITHCTLRYYRNAVVHTFHRFTKVQPTLRIVPEVKHYRLLRELVHTNMINYVLLGTFGPIDTLNIRKSDIYDIVVELAHDGFWADNWWTTLGEGFTYSPIVEDEFHFWWQTYKRTHSVYGGTSLLHYTEMPIKQEFSDDEDEKTVDSVQAVKSDPLDF